MSRFLLIHGVLNPIDPFPAWRQALGVTEDQAKGIWWGEPEQRRIAQLGSNRWWSLPTSNPAFVSVVPESFAESPAPSLSTEDETFIAQCMAQVKEGAPEAEPFRLEVDAVAPGVVTYGALDLNGAAIWLKVIETALREVYLYLRNREYRDAIRTSFEESFEDGDVVVAHSMGSVIAYDCLTHADLEPKSKASQKRARALVTFGSPLGLNVLRKIMPGGQGALAMPPRLAGSWLNAFDADDAIVGIEDADVRRDRRGLSDEFAGPLPKRFAEKPDIRLPSWPHHDAVQYLERLKDQIHAKLLEPLPSA